MRYFELCFEDGYSMIIKTVREPSIEEAERFIEADMKNMGYDHISKIFEWTREEAEPSFDFSREAFWPVFGENQNRKEI